MGKIKVLLAEDHTIVRHGLRALLEGEGGIEVIGDAEDGREAVRKVEQLRPDVVVMDISMPGLTGLEATRQIKKRFPETRVVVLSMHTAEEYVAKLLRSGASGYVVKHAAPAELALAIQSADRGELFLSPSVARHVVKRFVEEAEAGMHKDRYDKLTEREREVLQLIAEGHPNREIARLLHISTKTVESHKAHLMDKLDIHSTAELTRYAIHKGVITLER